VSVRAESVHTNKCHFLSQIGFHSDPFPCRSPNREFSNLLRQYQKQDMEISLQTP
jgi:hypothetical protein